MDPRSEGSVWALVKTWHAGSWSSKNLPVCIVLFVYCIRFCDDHLITLNLLPLERLHMTLLDTDSPTLRNEVSEVFRLVVEADLEADLLGFYRRGCFGSG